MHITSTQTYNVQNISTQAELDANGPTSCLSYFRGRVICSINLASAMIAFVAGTIAEAGAEILLEDFIPIEESESSTARFGKLIIHKLVSLSFATTTSYLAYQAVERLVSPAPEPQPIDATRETEGLDNPALSLSNQEVQVTIREQ